MNTTVPSVQGQSSLGVVQPGGQQGQYPIGATPVIPSTGSTGTLGTVATSNTTNTNNTTIQQLGTSYWLKQPKANAELFALTYGALVAELVRDMEDPIKITDELDRMGHSIGIRCIEDVLAKKAISDPGTSSDYYYASSSSSSSGSSSFYESADLMKLAFRMFLGIVIDCSIIDPAVVAAASTTTTTTAAGGSTHGSATSSSNTNYQAYSIRFIDNPLTIFVELPEEYRSKNTGTSTQQQQSTQQQTTTHGPKLEYNQLLAGMVRGMLEMLHYDCTCSVTNSILHGNDYNELKIELKQILQDGAGDDYHEE